MKLYRLITTAAFFFLFQSCTKDGAAGDNASEFTSSIGKAGSLSRFAIVGNFLYAVDQQSLYSYDISDRANPVFTNNTYINFNVETIYPFKNWLFIGTTTGLQIYSLDDPANPIKTGEATHARSCDPVVANDSYSFSTLKGNSSCGPAESGLYVHNISNIYAPELVKMVPVNNPEGLGLQGDFLYICCNNDGLKVFNVSQPLNPVLVKTVTGEYFKDVIPYGNLLICYVSNGIVLYDVADPSSPAFIKLIN